MLIAFHLVGLPGRGVLGGCGAMAQLVARLHGMQKVRGSNPLSSTFSLFSQFKGHTSTGWSAWGAAWIPSLSLGD